MHYLRIYNGDEGATRLDDREIEFSPAPGPTPSAPPIDFSVALPAKNMLFLRAPAGWEDRAHPAPMLQWLFLLSGRVTITAGSSTRELKAGDVFLVEDTAPPGHGLTVLEDAVFAAVRL